MAFETESRYGTAPSVSGDDTDAASAPRYGDPPGRPGVLLGPIATDEEQKKVAKAALRLWTARDKYMQPLLCQWKLNVARRKGITNGKLVYNSADDSYASWFPEDASPDSSPDSNKAASLCRKFPSVLFADPPRPTAEPGTGDNDDEDSAEFCARALLDLQSEPRLRTVKKARTAFDRASDFGSGFIYYYVDPRKGGRIPIEIIAHPNAPHLDVALVDPETGQENPAAFISRYVKADGALTDDAAEAATKWAPDMCSEVVTGRNIRPIPHTASDIDGAHGVQIGVFETLGQLRERFEQIEKMDKEAISKMLNFRPEHADMLKPPGHNRMLTTVDDDQDESLVFVLTTIYEQGPQYENGLYLVTLGDCYVGYRGDWSIMNEGKREKLVLPVAQFKQWDEGRDSFYGVGSMEILGGANEVRSAQLAAQLDWLDKLNNQKIFLPVHSVLDPKQLQFSRATVLYMNPGGEPSYQTLPPYPRESVDMREQMTLDMNDAIGLQEAGQGLQSPSINSGRQAMAVLSQVQAALSEPRTNIEAGYLRCCRIELQLARAFLPEPQRWHITGDDGGYKEQSWRTSDLNTTADLKLAPGSLSMLSPTAKAQFTEHLFLNLQLIGPDEAKEMISSNLSGVLGLQDDPFRMRVRRQIAAWAKGPPDGWVEQRQQQALQAEQMAMATPALPGMPPAAPAGPPPVVAPDPMTGQMTIVDPALLAIWEPVPCDTLPNISALRTAELAKLMSGHKYDRWPPDWRAGVDAEFARMNFAQQMAAMAAQGGEEPGKPGTPAVGDGPGVSGQPAPTPMEQSAEMFEEAGVQGLPTEMAGAE